MQTVWDQKNSSLEFSAEFFLHIITKTHCAQFKTI